MSELLLHNKWIFYYAPRGRNSKVSFKNSEKYEEQLQTIGELNTIKEFF